MSDLGPDLEEGTNYAEMLARSRIKELWQPGDLFHNFNRYPKKREYIDRLPLVLQKGLVPPALDTQGEVYTDVGIKYPEVPEEYQDLVFLHKFGPDSQKYIPSDWNNRINQ